MSGGTAKARPNVVVIVSDDQGAWALGCAGNAEIKTPHLDALAARGVWFENYYCTSPVCSPARASLLTGRIPSQHGVHDWIRAGNATDEAERDGMLHQYLADTTCYTELLANAGYRCGLSGKWHLGDSHHRQKGFEFWRTHARGGGRYYNAPMIADEERVVEEPRYVTDVITDNAIDFLREPGESPFYLQVTYTAPHSPWYRDQHPADYFDPYFDTCPFESVPDEPKNQNDTGVTDFFDSPELRREKLAGYYAAVTAMDAGIGRILETLDSLGVADETLVFFTSDNGMNMGHHGICGKGNGTLPINMFETSVKVPAILAGPGVADRPIAGGRGRVVTELVNHYDWMPTLLDYLGIDHHDDTLPGRSVLPLLRGEEMPDASAVAIDEYGPTRMIRRGRYKYIHRYPGGPHEFYNLDADPDERENLYHDEDLRETIVELREELFAWMRRYVHPEIDGSTLAITGRGQMCPANEPQHGEVPFAQFWMKQIRPDR